MLAVYYIGIKAAFLFGLVHSFVKFEPLQKHWLFLGLLYTAGLAIVSWVFFVAPQEAPESALADLLAEDRGDRRDLLQVAPTVRRGVDVLDVNHRGPGRGLFLRARSGDGPRQGTNG